MDFTFGTVPLMDPDVIGEAAVGWSSICILSVVGFYLFRAILFVIGFAFGTSKTRQCFGSNTHSLTLLDEGHSRAYSDSISDNLMSDYVVSEGFAVAYLQRGRWLGPTKLEMRRLTGIPIRFVRCGDRFRKPIATS